MVTMTVMMVIMTVIMVMMKVIMAVMTKLLLCNSSKNKRREDSTRNKKERGNILVAITAKNTIWVDRRQVDPRALRANIERLRAENPQGAVVIQADRESKNALLVEVMDAARLAGVTNVSIAADVID